MATKKKSAKSPEATEKARKAVLAEIQARLEGKPPKAGEKKSKASKATKPAKAPKQRKPRRMSALDAAAKVLADAGKPMRSKELIESMKSKGLWSSPNGKTPEATLYASMIREVVVRKGESRFKKVDRGQFVSTGRGG